MNMADDGYQDTKGWYVEYMVQHNAQTLYTLNPHVHEASIRYVPDTSRISIQHTPDSSKSA